MKKFTKLFAKISVFLWSDGRRHKKKCYRERDENEKKNLWDNTQKSFAYFVLKKLYSFKDKERIL